jgi:UDP-N-acetylglucosamine--N-acetylmuramyl-(pentapeptide) pyrophosphoryl-undecaprenol N-acetylglucosamine transferase
VAIAQRLLETEYGGQVLFVGTERGIEATILPKLGLPLRTIDISGFTGKGPMAKLSSRRSCSKRAPVAAHPRHFRPMWWWGRRLCLGPGAAGREAKGLPFLIHEQNAWPGLTNRLLARWAERVCVSFPDADRAFHRGRTVLTGNPLRRGMEDCPPVPQEEPQLLIFGGSRGARAINQLVVQALQLLDGFRGRLRIVHQTGAEDWNRFGGVSAGAGKTPVWCLH